MVFRNLESAGMFRIITVPQSTYELHKLVFGQYTVEIKIDNQIIRYFLSKIFSAAEILLCNYAILNPLVMRIGCALATFCKVKDLSFIKLSKTLMEMASDGGGP